MIFEKLEPCTLEQVVKLIPADVTAVIVSDVSDPVTADDLMLVWIRITWELPDGKTEWMVVVCLPSQVEELQKALPQATTT